MSDDKIINKATGELLEAKTPNDFKTLWLKYQQAEKEAKAGREALKPHVMKLIEDNSGNPVEFADGFRFVKVDSQEFAVEPEIAFDALGKATFLKVLKPGSVDLKLLGDLLESGEVKQPAFAKVKDARVPFRAKSYAKLEKVRP